jgi:REP element-mobilizing transposase RayT
MHRRLPHWQPDGAGYFVTWILAGSLPAIAVADLWTSRGAAFVAGDRLLDAAPSGPRWLTKPEVATAVVTILREGVTDKRYELAAYVLMPNHVHLLLRPEDTLPRQIAWIKGRTAFEANRVLKRSGSFRAKDYLDRWIRNDNECEKVIRYAERNPVKAGLCKSPEEWEWSSARRRD